MERYLDLLQQQRELQERIEVARDREVAEATAAIVKTMTMYNITLDAIRKALPLAEDDELSDIESRYGGRRVPKYLDPSSGRTWCGRGRRPKWLVGKNLGDFLLK